MHRNRQNNARASDHLFRVQKGSDCGHRALDILRSIVQAQCGELRQGGRLALTHSSQLPRRAFVNAKPALFDPTSSCTALIALTH